MIKKISSVRVLTAGLLTAANGEVSVKQTFWFNTFYKYSMGLSFSKFLAMATKGSF